MKGIKTILLIMCISWGTYAQMYNRSYYGDMDYLSISINTSSQLKHQNIGIQLKGDFDTWYAAFNLERLKHDNNTLYQYGFSVGKLWKETQRKYFLGARANIIKIDVYNKPSFGLEAEANQYITHNLFIGLGLTSDIYWNSPNIQTPTSKQITRLNIKIGIDL